MEVRLLAWEQPHERRSATELPVRRVHVRLVLGPRLHLDHAARGYLHASSQRGAVVITGRAFLGGGVSPRERRDQHDGEEQGQAGYALAVPAVRRQSAVCTAASILEAGLPLSALKSESKAGPSPAPVGLLQDPAPV